MNQSALTPLKWRCGEPILSVRCVEREGKIVELFKRRVISIATCVELKFVPQLVPFIELAT